MIPSEREELLAAGKKYAELSKEIIKKWRAKLPEMMSVSCVSRLLLNFWTGNQSGNLRRSLWR